MMTVVINVPGLLFDFSSAEARERYKRLEEIVLTGRLEEKGLEEGLTSLGAERFELLHDAYAVEELSYRARLFALSYLDKLTVQRALVRFNLDAFITNVISLRELKFSSVREAVDKVSRAVNSRNWILLTNSKLQSEVFRAHGVKTVLVSSEGRFKDVWQYTDSTTSHKVDESFYYRGCR